MSINWSDPNLDFGLNISQDTLNDIAQLPPGYANVNPGGTTDWNYRPPTVGDPASGGGGGSTGTAAPAGPTQAQLQMMAVLRDFMNQNGMGDLLGAMEKYVREGYSGDAVWVMTKNDPAYKEAYARRFAANARRAAQGLPELSPATYIEMEQGYRTAMMNRGMPAGLFDAPDDFTKLIEADVSVREVGQRLDMALDYINFDGNAAVKQQLRDLYGMTDAEMAAYVLDPTRTADYLSRETSRNQRRAAVGGAAVNAGLPANPSLRDQVAELMSTDPTAAFVQATQGYGAVARQVPDYMRLGRLSNQATSADELVTEQFGVTGAAEVTQKKKVLASQERARFGGSSGLGATSLSAGRRAQ